MNRLTLLLDLLLPRRCIVCQEQLNTYEMCLCTTCVMNIPRQPFSSLTDNELIRRFWNVAPVCAAASLMKYRPGTATHSILEAMKYKGRTDVCQLMGRMLATELAQTAFFQPIDFIIPIPLARQRKRIRGYNQSEHIARGIKQVTGIPIDTKTLWRKKDNTTQTSLSAMQREHNVQDIFAIKDASSLNGKHILIVDDIVTTGSTISSAIKTLTDSIPHLTVSVACVGLAQL